METITIIGTGLIGGSFGMALRKQGHYVIGCDKSRNNLLLAKRLNAVDTISDDMIKAVRQSTIVVLATPVDQILDEIPQVLGNLNGNAMLIDTGSTKVAICQRVKDHPRRNAFMAAHPMAGSEQSGPQAASPNLFISKRVAICESELTSQTSISKGVHLLKSVGLEPIFMNSKQHDSTVALVSHLPQILAYAFASLPDFDKGESKYWVRMASSGFDSSTRLALSVPEVWLPILFQNKEFLVDALRSLSQNIDLFANGLIDDNAISLIDKMERAQKTRVQFDVHQKSNIQRVEITSLTE